MDLASLVVTIVVAMSIPSGITGFCFWRIQKKIEKRDKILEEKEKQKEENELLLIKLAGASLSLGEATAAAVQRIPDANCNGDMHAALEYARKIKHEHKDALFETAVHSLI
ncbi:MAG: serine/threonine protein kinase [Eubacteriales bacterium]|nr:serine/threonine protein kinase [Eubacteriales bacterium]